MKKNCFSNVGKGIIFEKKTLIVAVQVWERVNEYLKWRKKYGQ